MIISLYNIGPLTKVITLEFFLDMVSSFSEDVTRVMREQPKRLSRSYRRRNDGNVIVCILISKQKCSLHSQPSFCSAGLSFVLCSFGSSLFGGLFHFGGFN